jgi:aminoglycoside phosphotransferase family enzyme
MQTITTTAVLQPTLQDKIGYLGRPGSYPDLTSRVEVVETHMSVVFLTDDHVYKLKKPVRHAYLDFSTLEARRIDCLEEVRLNRRLAAPVYLGVVPLAATAEGLTLEGSGTPVEWLVKMRRLPRAAMLDYAMSQGTVTVEDIERCMKTLCAFYLRSPAAPLSALNYRERFTRDIEAHRIELADRAYQLEHEIVERAAARLQAFVRECGARFDERIAASRVIESHGDLRPEHVCLAPEPLFIDCLEFDRDLRLLDTADEAGYLALECECAGSPHVGRSVLAAYRAHVPDVVPEPLLAFYQAQRAMMRAKLAAWHIKDGLPDGARTRWLERASRYLAYAELRSAAIYR